LPPGAATSPLRIDFGSALTTIDIASIRLTKGGTNYFAVSEETRFDSIDVRGDAKRLPSQSTLRVRVTGIDPRLHLPVVKLPDEEATPVIVHMRLRVQQSVADA